MKWQKAIAAIMGEEIKEGRRMTAFVKCAGDCESSRNNYVYDGVEDCSVMAFIPGGGEKNVIMDVSATVPV